ncbi:MAG: recombinase family protein [Holosporaceae bacterium]|jgi:DNA invertase Pin-like site-specific DNA recombinase|nr:recombinase family protein [Holosporaceae bacterium]
MLIGYMRVSKADGSQVLDLQKDALKEVGVDEERIYSDLASGRKDDRPGLRNCLKALQPGNTLVVWKLDRLGRDIKHLIQIVDDFNKKGIGLRILSGAGTQIDTTTASGKMMFGLFAVLAEFERDLIVERTRAGLAAARARGRKGGRPRKMDAPTIKMAMAAMSDRNSVAADVAKRLGITTTALYMYINGDGSPKEIATRILEREESV